MCTRPHLEPRSCKPLLPWNAGASGSMDKGRGFWFLPWPWCALQPGQWEDLGGERDSRECPARPILHHVSDTYLAKIWPWWPLSCHIPFSLTHPHLPGNLGHCLLWIDINHPDLPPWCVSGGIPLPPTPFPLLGVKFQPQMCHRKTSTLSVEILQLKTLQYPTTTTWMLSSPLGSASRGPRGPSAAFPLFWHKWWVASRSLLAMCDAEHFTQDHRFLLLSQKLILLLAFSTDGCL